MGTKISDLSALAGTGVAVGDLLPIVDVSAGTSGTKKITMTEFLNGLVTAATAGTALTGANSATDDEFLIYDLSATAAKKITRAETEVAMRNARLAAELVTLSGSTSITAATHGYRTCLLGGSGSAYTQTLPAASGTGVIFRFVVSAVNTSNHLIKVANSSDVMKGSVNSLDNDSTAQTAYAASGTDDTITLNGTTTGGQIGDWIELQDIAANTWSVRGQLVVPAGSNIADMFSATV